MCSHVPNKGEQMVRYYGYYINVSRGKRKKENEDDLLPCILEPDRSSKEYRKNWVRLIQKIHPVKYYTWTLPLYIIVPLTTNNDRHWLRFI